MRYLNLIFYILIAIGYTGMGVLLATTGNNTTHAAIFLFIGVFSGFKTHKIIKKSIKEEKSEF